MKKEEFLKELELRLQGLPEEDKKERVSFYKEMIEDRVDEGKTEEEAINALGGLEKVTNEIIEETPLMNLVKERVKPKRSLRAWEIILLILGFPLWFPLLLVFFVLCLIAYLLIWIGVIVIYSIELALNVSSVTGLILFIAYLTGGTFSLYSLGMMILGAGLSILLFFGCVGVTKGTCLLSRNIVRKIKSSFVKKGETK